MLDKLNMVGYAIILIIAGYIYVSEELSLPPDLPDEKKRIDFDAVVYWDYRSPDGGGIESVILLSDYQKKKVYTLIGEDYINRNGVLSRDGKYLLFTSAREGSARWRKIAGGGAPKNLYLFAIATRKTELLDLKIKELRKLFSADAFSMIRFIKNDSCIFIADTWDARFFEYNLYTHTYKMVFSVKTDYMPVHDMVYDDAGAGLFIHLVIDSKSEYYFYSVSKGEMQKIELPQKDPRWGILGGNSTTKKVYFSDLISDYRQKDKPDTYTLYEFDISTRELKVLRERFEFGKYRFNMECLREGRYIWGTIMPDSTSCIFRYDLVKNEYKIYGEGWAKYMHFAGDSKEKQN